MAIKDKISEEIKELFDKEHAIKFYEVLWRAGVNIEWIAKKLSNVLGRPIDPDTLIYPNRQDFSEFEKEVEGK